MREIKEALFNLFITKQSLDKIAFWYQFRQPLLADYQECKAVVPSLFRVKGRSEDFAVSMLKELLQDCFSSDVKMELYSFKRHYAFTCAIEKSLSQDECKPLREFLRDLAIKNRYCLEKAVKSLENGLDDKQKMSIKKCCQRLHSTDTVIHFFKDILIKMQLICLLVDKDNQVSPGM